MNTAKPGWQTSEFWLSAIVTIMGLVMASGMVKDNSTLAKGMGLAASALAALGYSASRGGVKSAHATSDGQQAAADASTQQTSAMLAAVLNASGQATKPATPSGTDATFPRAPGN